METTSSPQDLASCDAYAFCRHREHFRPVPRGNNIRKLEKKLDGGGTPTMFSTAVSLFLSKAALPCFYAAVVTIPSPRFPAAAYPLGSGGIQGRVSASCAGNALVAGSIMITRYRGGPDRNALTRCVQFRQ